MEDWNEIISNDARQMELSDLAETYKVFRRKAEEFDDGFRRNADSAYGLFCNEWIAREYLVLCADTERRNRSIFSTLSGGFNILPEYTF